MDASAVLDFKSTTLYAIRVLLHTADTDTLLSALDARMAEAAGFFEDEPVVIDASRLDTDLDWPRLIEALRRHDLPAIGVVAQGALLESARAAGLAQVPLPAMPARTPSAPDDTPPPADQRAGKATAPAAAAPAQPAPAAEPESAVDLVLEATAAPSSGTLVIDRPLRSGQRIYARQADLIVLGIVSHGAEVIADGNIHVYGPLRGKAMAGARGDTRARVFTTRFEAELVAVAGVYRTLTSALPPEIQNKPASVRLDGDKLLVESLAI